MLVIYNGGQRSLSINFGDSHLPFLELVPTLVPDYSGKILLEMNGFSEYEPGQQVATNTPDVFIAMPTELHFFLAALHFVRRCKEGFPTCRVHVQCRPEYKTLLPGGVFHVAGREAGTQYYRDFNLTTSALVRLRNEFTVRSAAWPLLIETMVRYAKDPEYYNVIPPTHEHPLNEGTVLFTQGYEPKVTAPPALAELLDDRLAPTELVDFAPEDSKLSEVIEKLRNCKTAVFCGDTPYIYLALNLGCEVYALRFTGFKEDMTLQYQVYPNFNLVLAGEARSVEEVADKFLEALTEPKVVPLGKATGEEIPADVVGAVLEHRDKKPMVDPANGDTIGEAIADMDSIDGDTVNTFGEAIEESHEKTDKDYDRTYENNDWGGD